MKIKSGKIERIPSVYSDDLFRMIQAMMHLEKEKRPSVEDLMSHPKISKIIKEHDVQNYIVNQKRKEEDLLKKEKAVKEREVEIEKKLKEVEEKEKQLADLEAKLIARQAVLN